MVPVWFGAVNFAVVIGIAGCALTDPTGDGITDGLVSIGFEVSAFEPCRSDEISWMTGPDAVYEELGAFYRNAVGERGGPAYARLRGVTSTMGSYGHLGAYDRQFRVTEVFDVTEATGLDCAEK